jgi:hypothetical protein
VARVEGDFSGTGTGRDAVYVLRRITGDGYRIVLMIKGEDRYDVTYDSLAVVARFPKSLIDSTEWRGFKPDSVDGDGILLVLKADDPTAAVVLFTQGKRVISAAPGDYLHMNLQ